MTDDLKMAALELESLIPGIKEIIENIKAGKDPDPYASLYWMRWRIGHIIRPLIPSETKPNLRKPKSGSKRACVERLEIPRRSRVC